MRAGLFLEHGAHGHRDADAGLVHGVPGAEFSGVGSQRQGDRSGLGIGQAEGGDSCARDVNRSAREDVETVSTDTCGDRGPFGHHPFDLHLQIGGKLGHRLDVIACIGVGRGITERHRVEIPRGPYADRAAFQDARQPRPARLRLCGRRLAANKHYSAGSKYRRSEKITSEHRSYPLLLWLVRLSVARLSCRQHRAAAQQGPRVYHCF